jgi:hypothetical protein
MLLAGNRAKIGKDLLHLSLFFLKLEISSPSRLRLIDIKGLPRAELRADPRRALENGLRLAVLVGLANSSTLGYLIQWDLR